MKPHHIRGSSQSSSARALSALNGRTATEAGLGKCQLMVTQRRDGAIRSILAGVALSNALPAPVDTDPAPAMMELRTVFVISLAALMAWSVERDVAGSTIKSIPDAFWWAITTVTSVGYGDKIPVSPEGKAVAVVLMFMGVALFGAIAAHACDGLHQVGYQAERCLIGPHRTARSQDRPR